MEPKTLKDQIATNNKLHNEIKKRIIGANLLAINNSTR